MTLPRFDNLPLDEQLERYYSDLDALTESALSGDMEERDFVAEMERIVTAAVLLMFLLGGGSLAVSGAQRVVDERTREQRRSIRSLADDIYGGRYSAMGETTETVSERVRQTAEEGREKLRNRLSLWAVAAAALYREGQVHSPPRVTERGERRERAFMWRRGPTSDSCRDCRRFDGVVLTASEWRRLPRPQSHDLECQGWRCLCTLIEVEEEATMVADELGL